jgi:3-oxoacyl-[acyl-carrier protein] reductase
MNHQNQAAIVSGAGEGIGFEIARQLAEQGAQVLLNDIDMERAEKAAAQIRAGGGQCIGTGGDVGQVEDVYALVERVVAEFGRLDIAVANAGFSFFDDFFAFKEEDFYRIVRVNLGGSFFLAQAAARQMRTQGSPGRILLMSSVLGTQADPQTMVYGMTKRGIEMLARGIGVALAPYKITVNAIAPGATVTPRTLHDNPDYESDWQAVTPTGRPARPEDIANAALFLLSKDAGHITGQTLLVDGGWTLISPQPG